MKKDREGRRERGDRKLKRGNARGERTTSERRPDRKRWIGRGGLGGEEEEMNDESRKVRIGRGRDKEETESGEKGREAGKGR